MTPAEYAHSLGLQFSQLYVTRWYHPPDNNRDPDALSFRHYRMFCLDGCILSAPVMAEPEQIRSWFNCDKDHLRKGKLVIEQDQLLAEMRLADGEQVKWLIEIRDPKAIDLTPLGQGDPDTLQFELAPT